MKKIEAVKVSFITFLQARLLLQGSPLATSIDDWIELTISLNKSKIIKKLRSSFEAFENGKYSSEIIEFELDSLDSKWGGIRMQKNLFKKLIYAIMDFGKYLMEWVVWAMKAKTIV